MSNTDLDRLSVAEFIERFRTEMVPLSNTFSYFFAGMPLTEEDVKDYLEEPIAALPPETLRGLPKTAIFLVPFLERLNGGGAKPVGAKPKRHATPSQPGSDSRISMTAPAENRQIQQLALDSTAGPVLVFAIQDVDLADYHYRFYNQVAALAERQLTDEQRAAYLGLLREELSAGVHGEVDEASWHHKQALRRRGTNFRRDSKGFREYASHSFIDTLTLYLHGICCDIDVDTGPRQLQSRHLRKRLEWMESVYPPPSGYAVFPEELAQQEARS
ncbi:MAG: hypothetical protein SFV51_27345 [Bryobacteraceae bacterium]|nr:hypothetical protein [Bryobacteraceae bacterium]